MKSLLVIASMLLMFSAGAQEEKLEILPTEIQIKTAVLSAPENKREGAAVYGYDENGAMVLLRKGTNDLVCIADNPNNKGISVSCYFKALEPFMKRGRALRKEGKNRKEVQDTRKCRSSFRGS